MVPPGSSASSVNSRAWTRGTPGEGLRVGVPRKVLLLSVVGLPPPVSSSPGPASSGDGNGHGLLPAIFLSTFFIRLGFGLTLSIYAFYLSSDVETVGLTAAASPIVEFSTVLFVGIAADRFGRLPVLRAALASGAILLLAMSLTRDPLDQTLLSALFGLTSASILASSLAVTGNVSGKEERGLEMGRFDAVNLGGWVFGFSLGYILVSLLDADLKHSANLAVAFWIGGAVVLFALLLLVRLSRGHVETRQAHVLDPKRLKEALLKPAILLVVLPWSAIYMLIGALFTFLGSAATTYHIPPWELGTGVAVGGTLLLFTQPFYGKLSDRYGRSKVMLVGVAGFLGVLGFGTAIALYGLRVPFIAGIGLSAMGALAFGPSSLAALTDVSKRTSRATTMALYSMTIAGGMGVGLISSSLLFTKYGVNGVVAFFGLVGAILVVFTLLRVLVVHPEAHQELRGGEGSSPPGSERTG